mgnify:CR=1 FL=1
MRWDAGGNEVDLREPEPLAQLLGPPAPVRVGSALGVGIGFAASRFINWYYQGVYRTPLNFSLVTSDIVAFAVGLCAAVAVLAGPAGPALKFVTRGMAGLYANHRI